MHGTNGSVLIRTVRDRRRAFALGANAYFETRVGRRRRSENENTYESSREMTLGG
jgi:hypothetical protein